MLTSVSERWKRKRRIIVIPERSINNLTVSVKGYNCNRECYNSVFNRFLKTYQKYVTEVRPTIHDKFGTYSTLVVMKSDAPFDFYAYPEVVLAEGTGWY